MENLAEFVHVHGNDDISKLILDRGKYPEIDMELAVNSIESRRKLKGKVPQWFENKRLIFPYKLSAEQCSSSATAQYKADIASRISPNGKIADLTGGLGVDSFFFSKVAKKVLYNEMQEKLCHAARHNFSELKADNISISCEEVRPQTIGTLLKDFCPDIVFIDPARRGQGGKKLFLIEDCTPDVLGLKDEIFKICRHILLKLSPMADIGMACERLGGSCREVHVVASGGECKELLIWMDKNWSGSYMITASELPADYPNSAATAFTFSAIEEKTAISKESEPIFRYLFEPGKALMKSGAFKLISSRFEIGKLAQSTHYYTSNDEERAQQLKAYGKVFNVIDIKPLDKRSIRDISKTYPQAEVTARNIPLSSEELRKKIGCSSGESIHIFGLRSDSEGAILIISTRI